MEYDYKIGMVLYLRNIKSPVGDSNLFASSVSELVLETREFDMLLGKIDRNGKKKVIYLS